MTDEQLEHSARQLGEQLLQKGYSVVTAESCTGGGLSEILTRIPGSSAWFERGFVTYSNLAKVEMLEVSEETLQKFGAVSEATALEMADGALQMSHGDLSVAITGIAGPDGGSEDKPVGLVCFAWAHEQGLRRSTQILFKGKRQSVRHQACFQAMQGLLELVA